MLELSAQVLGALRRENLSRSLHDSLQAAGYALQRSPDFRELHATDACNRTSRFVFGAEGSLERIFSPAGRETELHIDTDGALQSLRTSLGTEISFERSERTTKLRVDGQPKLEIEQRDDGARYFYPDGTQAELQLDPRGRVRFMRDRTGYEELFGHDEHGRLTYLADGNENLTRVKYGSAHELLPFRISYPNGDTEQLAWNDDALEAQCGDELWYRMQIDPQTGSRDAIFADGDRMCLRHDAAGRVIEAIGSSYRATYQYDAAGRVLEELSGRDRVAYGYDASGALTSVAYPGGRSVEYSYDADLRLTLVADSELGGIVFTYDVSGRTLTQRYPRGVSAITRLVPAGKPQSQIVLSRESRTIAEFQYAYDAEGRLDSFRDSEQGAAKASYDAAGRLVEYSAPGGKLEHFAYDAAGNRIEAPQATARFNAANQLLQQGALRCEYDARGNVVLMVDRGRALRLIYNTRGFLTHASGSDCASVEYRYDAFGRRILKRTASEETHYCWAGETLIRETRVARGVVEARDYIYAPGSPTPIAMTQRGRAYYFITDHLSRPVRLIDEDGMVVWSATYGAFGAAVVHVDRVPNNFRAPGQYYDSETGLHYNRYRYYAPQLGRYLSRDPLLYAASTNLYVYANNDPLNGIDPLGLLTWGEVGKLAASGLAAAGAAALVVVACAAAPITVPALAVTALAGIAAGAVGMGLNEFLSEEETCWPCILKEMLRGAGIGLLAAAPFMLPAVAAGGVAAFAAGGAASGAISYLMDVGTSDTLFSWGGLALAVGLGAAFSAAGRFVQGKLAARARAKEPPPPKPQRVEATPAELQAAREAQARAASKSRDLAKQGRRNGRRTINSNGDYTSSGFKNQPEGVANVEKSQMMAHNEKIGHKPPRQGARDGDTPGSAASSHAEKKHTFIQHEKGTSEPTGVSREQCGDCRKFMRAHAESTGERQIIADPEHTRVYQPDGTVDVYNANNEPVVTVLKDAPPEASLTIYEGIPW